jgi:hypothetical protein
MDPGMEKLKWISDNGIEISEEVLCHLHREIRLERTFWHNKSISYLTWYATFIFALYSGFFILLTKRGDIGPFFILITTIPFLTVFLCTYAKKSIAVCYRQFLEHTTIMAKLDYILGLYVPIKCKMPDTEIFNNDPFLNPVRHHDFLKSNSKSEKFVEDELKATERTFAYKKQIFTVIQVLSVVIGVVVFLVGIYQIIMHFES